MRKTKNGSHAGMPGDGLQAARKMAGRDGGRLRGGFSAIVQEMR